MRRLEFAREHARARMVLEHRARRVLADGLLLEAPGHVRGGSGCGGQQARAVMGMFGLSGDKAFQDAASLSGGEKTKLALGQLVAGGHNLLLLDEPTNNLDPGSRTAIGDALGGWPGTMDGRYVGGRGRRTGLAARPLVLGRAGKTRVKCRRSGGSSAIDTASPQ